MSPAPTSTTTALAIWETTSICIHLTGALRWRASGQLLVRLRHSRDVAGDRAESCAERAREGDCGDGYAPAEGDGIEPRQFGWRKREQRVQDPHATPTASAAPTPDTTRHSRTSGAVA